MPYTFTITEVTNNITATVYESTVSVTVENIGFTISETQQVFSLTQYISSFTIYENAIELKVDDFDNYFMGDWNPAGVYERGDLINYNYSLYVSDINTGTTYTNNAAPSNDPKWRRVVWHEAPFAYATVTDYLYVGGTSTLHNTEIRGNLTLGGGAGVQGLTVNSTATFNGRAYFNNTATFSGDIEFNNNTLVVPKLRVTGTSTFGGYATFRGAIFVDAPVIVEASSDLRVAGHAIFSDISDGTIGDGRISFFNHRAEFNAGLYLSNGGLEINGKSTGTEFVSSIITTNSIGARSADRIYISRSNIQDIVLDDNLSVGKLATFTGTATFNNNAVFNKAITTTGTITSRRIVTDQLNLGGLEYPSNTGLYGQVLTTNGSTTATWVNLGDLTAWSLNENLYTNGYDIRTGYPANPLVTPIPNLALYRGDPDHDFGHIKFNPRNSTRANNPYYGTIYQDYQDMEVAAPSRLTLKSGDGGVWNSTSSIVINSTTQTHEIRVSTGYIFLDGDIYGTTESTPIRAQSGIRFSDGTIQTTAVPVVNIPIASYVTTGSVRIDGTYLSIDGSGILTINTSTLGPALVTGILTATNTVLGGIKVGQYLSSSGDGTLTVNTATLGPALVMASLVTATNTRLGGVKIGSGLNIDGTGLLSLNTNSVVTITTQITSSTIESYFFSTSTTYTITNEVGKLNLTQDAYTNGYTIFHSTGNYNFLTLGPLDSQLGSYHNASVTAGYEAKLYSDRVVTIQAGTNLNISATTNTTITSAALTSTQSQSITFTVSQGTQTSSISVEPDNIELLAKTVINLLAPLVSIGTQTSVTQIGQLRVDKIYNYEGTYAPFFPAGVQFNDNTVQRTAFEPDQGLL
jgi:hypothetical protein